MAAADVQQPPAEAAPAVPDYLASPNAVFNDEGVQWRYGKAPDYSKTRKVWEEGKRDSRQEAPSRHFDCSHPAILPCERSCTVGTAHSCDHGAFLTTLDLHVS